MRERERGKMGGARKMGEARVSWVTGIIFKMFAGNSKIYFHIYSMKIVWIYCGFLDANIIFIVWISLLPVCPDLSILFFVFLFRKWSVRWLLMLAVVFQTKQIHLSMF